MLSRTSLALLTLPLLACGTDATPSAYTDVLVLGDAGNDVVLGGEDGGTDTIVLDVGPPEQDLGDRLCFPNTTECDGDVLLTCNDEGSAVGRTRCSARGQVCVEEDGGGYCGEPICAPDVWQCVADNESAQCNTTGGGYAVAEVCPDGCDTATGRCAGLPEETLCTEFDVEPIAPGTYLFDLCNATDTAQHVEQNDCGEGGASSGGDGIFSFTLDRPSQVYFDLRDEDDNAAIDTIMYIRSACDDPSSQVDCSDDVACDDSDVEFGDCSGGLQVRQSRIERRLNPGTYYLWIDQLSYQNFGCGQVRLIAEY